MPLTRSFTRQPSSLFINTPARAVQFSSMSYSSSGSTGPLASPDLFSRTIPVPSPTRTHCACGCLRRIANIFESYTCGLNLSLTRSCRDLQLLIRDQTGAKRRNNLNSFFRDGELDTAFNPSEARARMLERADDLMTSHAKEVLSSIAETLKEDIMGAVEEWNEQEWGFKLREDQQKDRQQTTEEIDEGILSPDLRRMSDSLTSISLDQSAEATPIARTGQGRRDGPAPALDNRTVGRRRLSTPTETMNAIAEQWEDKLEVAGSNARKRLKRQHEEFLDKVEEATRAKKPKSK